MSVGTIVRRGVISAVLLAAAGPLCAQDAPVPFRYDIATIKPNQSGSGSTGFSSNTDHIQVSNMALSGLIASAYNLRTVGLLSGLPGWAMSSHYDIYAKVDEETLARLKPLEREQNQEARREMLRHLLEDRFKLQAHAETKELPIYELVVAKGGSKLTPSDPNNTYANGLQRGDGKPRGAGSTSVDKDGMTVQGQPIASLAQSLSGRLKRQVEDHTGLTGNFDYTLKFSDDDSIAADKGPDLFTALQEQLGLKLESTKGPVRTVVVDHIEPPTED